MLNCSEVGDIRTLVVDRNIKCSGAKYALHLAVAVLGIIVWIIGILVGVLCTMILHN